MVVGAIYCATLVFLYYNALHYPVHVKWTFPAGGKGGQPLIQPDGSLIVGALGGKVYAISSSGKEIWSHDTGARILFGVEQAKDGTVYAINGDYELFAIDPAGNLLWKTPIDQIGTEGRITVGRDAIYVSGIYQITSVSTEGTINWIHQDFASYWKHFLITDEGKLIIGERKRGNQEAFLICFNPDGSIEWKTKVASDIHSAAAFLPNGDFVVGSDDGLLCFNTDGVLQWNTLSGHAIRSDALVDDSGVTYCISTRDMVFAVDDKGNQVWASKLEAPGIRDFDTNFRLSLGCDSSLLIGSIGFEEIGLLKSLILSTKSPNLQDLQFPGFLFSLSTVTGQEQWHFKAPASLASTAEISEDGTIYIQSRNTLYALEPR